MPDENTGQENMNKSEGQQTEATPASNKPAEAINEQEALANSKNPERTKEYIEKLKEENKRLKEQAGGSKPQSSVLDVFNQVRESANQPQQAPVAQNYQNLNQNQVEQVKQQLYDENGYVDGRVLEQELKKANEALETAKRIEERARRAEDRVAQYEMNQQTRELHTQYPELDPNSSDFNEEAYNLVKNEVLAQYAYQGKQDPIAAAKKYEKYFRGQQTAQQQAQAQVSTESGSNRQAPPPQAPRGPIKSLDDFKARISAAGL
jgi:hypothetical protein